LKFLLVWDFIEETFGIPCLATGHYARVSKTEARVYLGRAEDKTKDQSYFLYGIPSEKLARFILPLGELTKEKVRSIATDLGLTKAWNYVLPAKEITGQLWMPLRLTSTVT
jgi:tRNA U34 2-thiouridine synthase MnmA/TrmU